MFGTASTVRSWLLLEHPGPWGVVALRDARLPHGVGEELRRRSRAAGVRVLLIRRPGRSTGGPPAGFAIRSGRGEPWIELVGIARLEDALELDLERLGRGERLGGEPFERPLFLVCAHGRRDPCCAERGRPLAEALSGPFPESTWESSHLGGDRFAGNLLAFPHGFVFGRVDPAAGPAVARGYLEGRLDLGRLRGRTCHPMAIQAAEHLLRVREGLDRIDDVEIERATGSGEELVAWFRSAGGRFEVRMAIEATAEPSRLTCRSEREELAPVYREIAIARL